MSPKPRPGPDIERVLHPERDRQYRHFADAQLHPFDAGPRSCLGRRNAWWLADAALLAYWDGADAIPRFAAAGLDARAFDTDGVNGYVARGPGFAIVTFRGTEPDEASDLFDDAKCAMVEWDGSPHRVHRGFRDALRRAWPTLHPQLDAVAGDHAVFFTGHSLGGALATLAAMLFPGSAGICTLGSPRVGDRGFAAAFSARFGDRSRRYVANTDIVTQVPPPTPLLPYKHVDHLRQISPTGEVGTVRTSMTQFFSTLLSDMRYLAQTVQLLRTGTMTAAPTFLLDHMPVGYAVDLWNDYDANGD